MRRIYQPAKPNLYEKYNSTDVNNTGNGQTSDVKKS